MIVMTKQDYYDDDEGLLDGKYGSLRLEKDLLPFFFHAIAWGRERESVTFRANATVVELELLMVACGK